MVGYWNITGCDTTNRLGEISQADEAVQVTMHEHQEARNVLNEKQAALGAWGEGKGITKDNFLAHGKKCSCPVFEDF